MQYRDDTAEKIQNRIHTSQGRHPNSTCSSRWSVIKARAWAPQKNDPDLIIWFPTFQISGTRSHARHHAEQIVLSNHGWRRVPNSAGLSQLLPNNSVPKYNRHLQSFLATGPIEFVAMESLDLMQKKAIENQHVFSIADKYLKLTGPVPTFRATKSVLPSTFFDVMLILYVISSFLLT